MKAVKESVNAGDIQDKCEEERVDAYYRKDGSGVILSFVIEDDEEYLKINIKPPFQAIVTREKSTVDKANNALITDWSTYEKVKRFVKKLHSASPHFHPFDLRCLSEISPYRTYRGWNMERDEYEFQALLRLATWKGSDVTGTKSLYFKNSIPACQREKDNVPESDLQQSIVLNLNREFEGVLAWLNEGLFKIESKTYDFSHSFIEYLLNDDRVVAVPRIEGGKNSSTGNDDDKICADTTVSGCVAVCGVRLFFIYVSDYWVWYVEKWNGKFIIENTIPPYYTLPKTYSYEYVGTVEIEGKSELLEHLHKITNCKRTDRFRPKYIYHKNALNDQTLTLRDANFQILPSDPLRKNAFVADAFLMRYIREERVSKILDPSNLELLLGIGEYSVWREKYSALLEIFEDELISIPNKKGVVDSTANAEQFHTQLTKDARAMERQLQREAQERRHTRSEELKNKQVVHQKSFAERKKLAADAIKAAQPLRKEERERQLKAAEEEWMKRVEASRNRELVRRRKTEEAQAKRAEAARKKEEERRRKAEEAQAKRAEAARKKEQERRRKVEEEYAKWVEESRKKEMELQRKAEEAYAKWVEQSRKKELERQRKADEAQAKRIETARLKQIERERKREERKTASERSKEQHLSSIETIAASELEQKRKEGEERYAQNNQPSCNAELEVKVKTLLESGRDLSVSQIAYLVGLDMSTTKKIVDKLLARKNRKED